MNFKQRFRYYSQYFPFTLNTFLCLVAAWFSYKLLYRTPAKDEPSPFAPFILLMCKMVFWFIVALVGLSVLSTIFSWAYYLWLKQKKGTKLEVSFTTETRKGKSNRLFMNSAIEGAWRPILGFVKGRLFYDNNEMTDKFSLLSNKRKKDSFARLAIAGRSRMALPDIKEYELRGGFVYFQDMLHLFSLAVKQPISGHFYQPPLLTNEEDKDVFPKKTETMDVRIDQIRRTEGELLNYKGFESGDDVRRIVWKVYAKNRDLVVRVPELFVPYASHLYFYASFHANVKNQWLGEGYLKEMLNYYKNNVWTVYDTLSHKEWEMRYIADQSLSISENLSEDERTARIISNSGWHTDRSLADYFKPKQGAVLCISSLVDVKELESMLEQCDASTVVYFVKVSKVFRHFVPLGWLQRLLFRSPKDRLNKLRTSWTFSPMRVQIQKREKEIEELLKRSVVTTGIL
jgi:hypothetical protein